MWNIAEILSKGSQIFFNTLYLYQLRLPAVAEGWVLLLVSLHGVLSVQGVDAEVAQTRAEKLVLGRVLQQLVLEAGRRHRLVDLDGLLVLLEGGGVLGHLEHALVGAAVGLLAAEVLGGLLVVLHRLVQVSRLGLEQLGDGLNRTNITCSGARQAFDRSN